MRKQPLAAVLLAGIILLAGAHRGRAAEGEKSAPAPIKLSGKGDQASAKFRLEAGLTTWTIEHGGRSNFQVALLSSDGKSSDMPVNEIGRFKGTQAVRVAKAGEYVLNVKADGKWAVTIEQPRPTDPAAKPLALKGKGPSVSSFVTLPQGLSTFRVTHKGEGVFRVKILDREGRLVEQVVAAVGAYEGSKAVSIEEEGVYLINIYAKGEWSLKVD